MLKVDEGAISPPSLNCSWPLLCSRLLGLINGKYHRLNYCTSISFVALKNLSNLFIVLIIEPEMVIIEYVPYGDLLGYLRKSRGLNETYYKDPDVKPRTNLTSQQFLKFAWQVADGIEYLSNKKVGYTFEY